MYALISLSPLSVVEQYGSLPSRIFVPGVLDVHAPAGGWSDDAYSLVPTVNAGTPADQFSTATGSSLSFDGTTLTKTTAYSDSVPTKQQLLDYAEQKARAIRNGGVTISSIPVATDTSGIALLTGAHDYVAANPSATVPFVVSQTVSVSLSASQINAMWFAVSGFIQSCYAAEASNNSAINAGTMTSTAEVDSALEQIQMTF